MTRLVSLAGLAVLAGLVLSISDVHGGAAAGLAPEAQSGGTIVFGSNRDGDYDIYAVNPDGTGLTQLTHNDFEDSSPIPSPDGRLIAFYSEDGGTLMSPDGSGRRSLQGCHGLESWSPDSTRLLCDDEDEGLVIADVASGTVTPLTASGRDASWSPDGRTIAFVDEERLFAIPAAGGARRRLGRRKVDEDGTPSWSPDSQRLAYAASAGKNFRQDLFTIGADGSGGHRLVRGISDFGPTWSPEGSLIAFTRELPHYVVAVYTVRADGTGLRRISVSAGGESSDEPAWSADGSALLYIRARYFESGDTDVFMTKPGARAGRPLTHPFPAGGRNDAPRWMIGPPLSGGGEPAPQTITLRPARKLTFGEPVARLITDGRHAIPYLGGLSLLVWDPIARRTVRTPRLCDSYGELALAGKRLAWTCSESGNTYFALWLETLRLGARRPTFVTETIADEEGGQTIGSLVGHGGTIAFTSFHGKAKRAKAWLLLARPGGKCPRNSDLIGPEHSPAVCRRLRGAAGGVTTSVDSGRVVTVASNGLVRLLSTHDRVLRSWTLDPGVVTARLRGRTLAVQQGSSLEVYNAATGAKRQTLPLAADEGLSPFLLDVHGDLVAYATGGAIHLLRLSDGRDRALDLPGAAGPLDARLEQGGLFVTWNQMYNRRRGRMAFVPMRAVIGGFE